MLWFWLWFIPVTTGLQLCYFPETTKKQPSNTAETAE
jgi:hypothetical protein